ncbi:MAG: radical SAM protein [archaeon]|nr:radical SAM protein [archaeon]
MKIGRFIRSSLSEWKGKNSCVIEVRGSALRSPFLSPIDLFEEDGPTINESEVLDFIAAGKSNLEAVSLNGGEPLLQKDLYQFLKKLKALKLPIILNTEGTCPDALDDMVGACMVDKVCVKVCSSPDNVEQFGPELRRSIDILSDSGIEYEVAIMAVPGITDKQTVESICRLVKGKGQVSIVRFDITKSNDPALKEFKKKEVLEFVASAKKFVKKVEVKGF